MRRAFTLIELLVIVAIMAVMVSASVASVRSGQDAARLRGATRDIFAAVRHSRSLALVSKQPCVVTYSMSKDGDDVCAKIEIDGAKIFHNDEVRSAQTLTGETVSLEPDDDAQSDEAVKSHTVDGESPVAPEVKAEGESIDEILFSPIASEVVRGVRIKVLKDDEALAEMRDSRRAKPRISVFSNVDYLIGRHNEAKAKAKADQPQMSADEALGESAFDTESKEPVKVVWEVNGRTDPHRIYIYLDGHEQDSGLTIDVDRFGAVKVLGQDGEEAL